MKTIAVPVWYVAGIALWLLFGFFVFGFCIGRIIEQERQLQFFYQVQPAGEGPGWFPKPDRLEVRR